MKTDLKYYLYKALQIHFQLLLRETPFLFTSGHLSLHSLTADSQSRRDTDVIKILHSRLW